MLTIHGLKLEMRNSGVTKRVYEPGVYKPEKRFSDMVRYQQFPLNLQPFEIVSLCSQ